MMVLLILYIIGVGLTATTILYRRINIDGEFFVMDVFLTIILSLFSWIGLIIFVLVMYADYDLLSLFRKK